MKSLGSALLTLGLFAVALGAICFFALRLTQGSFTYPLDDSYIHMSIARNLVQHGIWSVSGAGFTSSTSSPLWTLLLGVGFRIFGIQPLLPLVLAILVAALVVFGLDSALRSRGVTPLWRLAIETAAVFATPLPALSFTGMEHVLHFLLALAILHFGARALAPSPSARDRGFLIAACALAASVRYEALFMVAVLGLLLLAHRRIRLAFACGFAAVLPVALYGFWSRGQGWFLLPNSVLLKAALPSGSVKAVLKNVLDRGLDQLWANPQLLVLLAASLVLLSLPRPGAEGREHRDALKIYVGTLLLHLELAASGWFYRYEAYLVGLGIWLVGAGLFDQREHLRAFLSRPGWVRRVAALTLVIAVARPLGQRAIRSLEEAPRASANIYEQQVQMARFLERYDHGRPVALNDIGAVTWLANVRLVDLWGLGSLEPARLRLEHRYGPRAIDDISHAAGVEVAILYPGWFKPFGGLPAEWTEVGQWRISRNVVCGADSVSIYAVSPAAVAPLTRELREFDAVLPVTVARSGAYTKTGVVAALR
ncbi:MAG TPA: hypothetical protein VL123_09845 [Candidatus Udaeobacter sp.]|nr:hypothetical protein [Candidatus Udaeobacter sp.]